MQSTISAHSIQEIDINRISHSPNALRENVGPLDELLFSIQEKGLLQPIIVRPTGSQFQVVAGTRRLQACKRLGLTRIPCHVVQLDDKESFEISLVENVQRKTLNPVEEARAFRKYVNGYGYGGISELARKIGKSEQYVSQRLRILNLSKDLLEKLTRRLVTPSHAAELLGLHVDEQKFISELIVRKKISSKGVRRIAKSMRTQHDFPPDFLLPDSGSTTERQANRVSRVLGKCIVLLRTTLMRFDDLVETTTEEEWFVKEQLLMHRQLLHKQIDILLQFEKKMKHFKAYDF